MVCNQSSILSPECAAESVGPANQLVLTLVQTILTAHCMISPPEMWPKDYGKYAMKHGLDKNL